MSRKELKDFYFAIDLRSLALFRILIACILIYDWAARWPDIEAFYTSFGLLPIGAPLPRAGGWAHVSLMDGFTSVAMVRVAFGLGLACYLAFLLGIRTKLFHILSFLFFVSVLNRNIVIRHGGDVVIATMVMWSMFLPLGRRFSLDAVITAMRRGMDLGQPRGGAAGVTASLSEPSLASVAIVCQIALIYCLTAFDKHGVDWLHGTALYYSLHLDQFATPFGTWLSGLPLPFLKLLTWGTLAMEFAAAPLILLPFAQPLPRRIAILGLTTLHVGTWLTMQLGSFPFVMISSYALLLRPPDWEYMRRFALRWSRAVTVYYDDTCGCCHRCCQLLAIADRAGYIRFTGSSRCEDQLSKEELGTSIVTVDEATNRKTTKAAAVAAICRALPLPFQVGRLVGSPGISAVTNRVYDFVARHRYQCSEWLGVTACGLARVPEETKGETEQPSPLLQAWRFSMHVLANMVVALIFVSVLIESYNLNLAESMRTGKIPEPPLIQAIILSPQLIHDWNLFAPNPMKDGGWWVIDGVTESGESLDPLTGKAPTWEKPANVSARYNVFWQKYLYRLWLADYSDYRLYFGQYITRKNHREQPEGYRLERFKMYYVLETTLPPGSQEPFPTERKLLWTHDCFAGSPDRPKHKAS